MATVNYPNTALFIDGQWQVASDAKSIAVRNPASGQVIGHVAHAGELELRLVLESAQQGFKRWRDVTAFSRSQFLRRGADILRERSNQIAPLITQEQGKPLAEAHGEVMMCADMLDWFADEGMRVYGRIVQSRQSYSIRQMVLKEPVGVVAAFTPWNFPMNQVVRKVGAALASGCAIIIKAPEETPAGPAALVQALADAGVPRGVVSLIYGTPSEIADRLISSPIVQKVTFTGSTAVGKVLAALAGKHMKRVSMELGGHAPVIICDDADVALAIRVCTAAKFRNAGQICISPTRFLVHESVAPEFIHGFVRNAEAITLGDGLDASDQMGPLANPRRVVCMADHTQDALKHGATLLTGGARPAREGNFWEPTVLTNVAPHCRVFNEEPFGPIAAIRTFCNLDEAIAEANRLPVGLASYAFTTSLKNMDRIARELEAGMLWINMPPAPSAELPFGGVKDSGYGSEGGPEALEAYLSTRVVVVQSGVVN
jgi:succinate-semialdehyde dehydrogenase/glutarate-semialdehyde dehydrogenase